MTRVTAVIAGSIALLLTPLLVLSQAQPSPTKEVFTPDERQKATQIEDAVAARFEQLRKDAGVQKLSRVITDQKYRQILCTASIRESNPSSYQNRLRWVVTKEASGISQLQEVAVKAFTESRSWSAQRFVVTAYPVRTPNFPTGSYWVEIDFRMSAFAEWYEDHLTDEVFYKDRWKQGVAPECSDIR